MAIKKISVIGLGTLGTQIAIQAAYYGYEVRAYDQDPQVFQKTIQRNRRITAPIDRCIQDIPVIIYARGVSH